MNVIVLTGRIGNDPKMHTFENDNKKTSFSLAVSESYQKDGKWQEVTDWFNIALYRETKLKKGDLIEIVGKLKTRSYDKGGEKRFFTEVVASSARLLSRKETAEPEPKPAAKQKTDPEGDLPF